VENLPLFLCFPTLHYRFQLGPNQPNRGDTLSKIFFEHLVDQLSQGWRGFRALLA
jgi:hypothetical protein